jgi:hypothetical protein
MSNVMPPQDTSDNLQRVGYDDENKRTLFLLELAGPDAMPRIVRTGIRHFVALIVWDAAREPVEVVARVARTLLDAGCVYFCCWGPDCERVHDIIDEEYVGDGTSIGDDESTLMTTWHNRDSLDEAVWFCLNNAFPDDRYFDDSKAVVVICIGNAGWASQVRAALEDPRALTSRVV